MFSFKYSPRPNTLADKRYEDDVTEDEKTRRIVALQALQRDVQRAIHEEAVGATFDVLIDASSRRRAWELSGRTSGNTVVNLPGSPEWIGQVRPVTIRRAGPNSLWGEVETGPRL
jgi:tRNA-2-methylthio-N6-dimethylallyladenosine synthase